MEDEFYIVETEDDVFLGLIEFIAGGIIIRNGFQGHPKTVSACDIVLMMPAALHPSIEYIKAV